jgi:hypothetical protein
MADQDFDALNERYMKVLEALQKKPTDQLRAEKADLATKIVAIRQAARVQRETEALSLSNGEGVAQPRPVEGSTEVSS